MARLPDIEITELARVALASARDADRPAFAAIFALDSALARIASQAREPLLAQVRYAWWREQLERDIPQSASDPVLGLIHESFPQTSGRMRPLVDGWEQLRAEAALDAPTLDVFANGRAAAFALLAEVRSIACDGETLAAAARCWALADCAVHCRDPDDRALALAMAEQAAASVPRLPRRLRPLAVLAGMARRAIGQGGAPLLGDRLSPFVAARIAVSGW